MSKKDFDDLLDKAVEPKKCGHCGTTENVKPRYSSHDGKVSGYEYICDECFPGLESQLNPDLHLSDTPDKP